METVAIVLLVIGITSLIARFFGDARKENSLEKAILVVGIIAGIYLLLIRIF